MQYARQRVWFRYNRREDLDCCPLCFTPLRWVFDGVYWYPCDKEPVLFKQDNGGKLTVLKRRELIEGCKIYTSGDTDGYQMGLLPHTFTCSEIWRFKGAK